MDWVNRLREQFPAAQNTTFLDIAYENSGSLFAKEAVYRFLEDWSDVSPEIVKAGGAGKGNIISVVAETRQLLAALLGGVDPKNIAFTKNTNEGISMILQGFPFRPGDNVVTDDQEHPSVLIPCLNLQPRGVECRIAVSPDQVSVTPDLLWQHVDGNTRMIVISHVQSCSGYRTDIQELARRCREKGIYLVVDAIQSLGFCPCDAEAWQVDAISSACYKGMLGTEGIGFLYCRDELLEQVWPVYAAANDCISIDKSGDRWELVLKDPKDARKLENSTMNFSGIYSLNAGLKQVIGIGVDNIYAHISNLVDMLFDGLLNQGYVIATPADKDRRCHSIAFEMSDLKAGYEYFERSGVFLSLSAGRFIRMSVAPFTIENDIRKALEVARNCPIR